MLIFVFFEFLLLPRKSLKETVFIQELLLHAVMKFEKLFERLLTDTYLLKDTYNL